MKFCPFHSKLLSFGSKPTAHWRIFQILAILILPCCSGTSTAQNTPIKVYLLGTFHFAQTDSTYDVLDNAHQKDIQKLCDLIIKQEPDKVFVESMPDFEYMNRIDSLYQTFRKGSTLNWRNEIWQVGFRVAEALDHEHIYLCDHPGQFGYYYGMLEEYADLHGQQQMLGYQGKGITVPLTETIDLDSLMHAMSLLDYLRWMNSAAVQGSSHAHYINLYPQLGNTDVFHYDSTYFLGVELTTDWYRRNLKIYAKMLAQLDYTEDAIFLIIGNDHIPILRHLFESNPYFAVVPAKKWLGRRRARK